MEANAFYEWKEESRVVEEGEAGVDIKRILRKIDSGQWVVPTNQGI